MVSREQRVYRVRKKDRIATTQCLEGTQVAGSRTECRDKEQEKGRIATTQCLEGTQVAGTR